MMQRKLAWLFIALLCPMLSLAAGQQRDDYDESIPFWAGIGFGGGSITSDGLAPSGGRDVFTGNIEIGYRISRQFGLGVEYGLIVPTSGCRGMGCSPSKPEFAPDFSRWFLMGEYRPHDGGLRLRASAGVSTMCYRYYKGRRSTWDRFWDAVLFGNDGDDLSNDTSRRCKSLQALGAAVSVGYQWSLEDRGSLGLQLRGEAANYDASARAGTPDFKHRAAMMQLQFSFN
jgi:hypothetical protein